MLPNSPERLVSHWTLDRPAGAEGVRDIFRSIGAYFEQLEVFGIRRTHEVKCFVTSGRCDRIEVGRVPKPINVGSSMCSRTTAVCFTPTHPTLDADSSGHR